VGAVEVGNHDESDGAERQGGLAQNAPVSITQVVFRGSTQCGVDQSGIELDLEHGD